MKSLSNKGCYQLIICLIIFFKVIFANKDTELLSVCFQKVTQYMLLIVFHFTGSGQIPPSIYTTQGPVVGTVPVVGSTVTRQARRLYVGNIPFGCSEVMHFLQSDFNVS